VVVVLLALKDSEALHMFGAPKLPSDGSYNKYYDLVEA
jgi:hypothetical protein